MQAPECNYKWGYYDATIMRNMNEDMKKNVISNIAIAEHKNDGVITGNRLRKGL